MWCKILQRKISSPKAIIHAYSPECIRFSKFLPHTTSALRAPSPQGEGFDLCRPAKLRNKSECVRVTRVHFTLSALRAPLPKGEARARWIIGNRPINRNLKCNPIFGLVAQPGERTVRIRKVEGSIPFESTMYLAFILWIKAGTAFIFFEAFNTGDGSLCYCKKFCFNQK